jgi:hypothetical protein
LWQWLGIGIRSCGKMATKNVWQWLGIGIRSCGKMATKN